MCIYIYRERERAWPEGVGAVSAINHYHGRDGIPIGAYKGPFDNPQGEDRDDAGPLPLGLLSLL